MSRSCTDRGPGVALGTLYRYFSSKVHLLVALQHDRARAMIERVAEDPPPGDDPIERATTSSQLDQDLSTAARLILR